MKGAMLGVLVGAILGASLTHLHHSNKAMTESIARKDAEHERNQAIATAATHWKKMLDDANSRAAAIPERVFVKADCVRSSGDSGLADGTGAARIALDEAVVRSVAAVGEDAEAQYRRCSHKLAAAHEILERLQRSR